jgi:Mor family transcriptional regulator
MTTRERDERDLAILRDYEAGWAVNDLVRKYKSTTPYVKRLIEEALDAED